MLDWVSQEVYSKYEPPDTFNILMRFLRADSEIHRLGEATYMLENRWMNRTSVAA